MLPPLAGLFGMGVPLGRSPCLSRLRISRAGWLRPSLAAGEEAMVDAEADRSEGGGGA